MPDCYFCFVNNTSPDSGQEEMFCNLCYQNKVECQKWSISYTELYSSNIILCNCNHLGHTWQLWIPHLSRRKLGSTSWVFNTNLESVPLAGKGKRLLWGSLCNVKCWRYLLHESTGDSLNGTEFYHLFCCMLLLLRRYFIYKNEENLYI